MDRITSLEAWQEKALVNQEAYLKKVVETALQKALEAQFADFIQANEYERTATRNGYRNGSYNRELKTRVGTVVLEVCRDRDGNFKPSVFEKYQRSEKALMTSVMEMYVNGVSTRRVSAIVEELCGIAVSKSLVSSLSQELDTQVEAWRNRRLGNNYSYLVLDARYERVREGGVVKHKAVVIPVGITAQGVREILGCWVINSESYDEWSDCFERLKQRGLEKIEFAVSDENKGLRKALARHFQGAKLQRCQVHYMRNFLSKLSRKDQKDALLLIKEVFAANTKERAYVTLGHLITLLLDKKKDKVADWLEETIEDTLQVLELPPEHRNKMKSTNMLERVNQEIKRRTKTIRIFPNEQSCLRLVSTLCQEISEKWSFRKYLTMEVSSE